MQLPLSACTLAARTFRILTAITAYFDLNAKQYDIVNAFIDAELDEIVCCNMPYGFKQPGSCGTYRKLSTDSDGRHYYDIRSSIATSRSRARNTWKTLVSYPHATKLLAAEYSGDNAHAVLETTCDDSFADDVTDRKSTKGYVIKLFGSVVATSRARKVTKLRRVDIHHHWLRHEV